MRIKKIKFSVFTSYMILFFSMIFVAIFLYIGFDIILTNIYKNNYFISRNAAELLASILNYVFSSTNNISIELIFPPTEMKIYFYKESIMVEKGKEYFSFKIFKPNYISLSISNNVIEMPNFFDIGKIGIFKINDEIIIIG